MTIVLKTLSKFDDSRSSYSIKHQILLSILFIIIWHKIIIKFFTSKDDTQGITDKYKFYLIQKINPKTFLYLEWIRSIRVAILEEIAYRIVLFNGVFIQFFKLNIFTSIIMSSIIFGLSHCTTIITDHRSLKDTLEQCNHAFFFGVAMCLIYYYTNSPFSIIFIHLIWNMYLDYQNYKFYNHLYNKSI